jgi:pyruvate dehydrogenase E2 component (dihydrolipoamide acetyltransferase)
VARVDVIMPQMGESIAEGTLSRWLKKVGDEVKRDEPIFEISTDKVDAEIPSPSAGVIVEVLVKEGETVPVDTVVAKLETEKGAAATAADAPQPPAAAKAHTSPPAPAAAASAASAPAAPSQAAPSPGSGGRPDGDGASFEERVRTKSSPLVRKIAAEHGLEIASMRGSGVAGRVTKRDILAFIDSGAARATGQSMYAPGGAEQQAPPPEAWPGDRVEPMSPMRAKISERMVVSRRTSAHVTSFMEVDFTRVARIRAARRAEFEAASGQKLTYMPFIIKSVVAALKSWPILNSSVAGNSIIYRRPANIGIAVALDWGLIVPVIKGAEELSLVGLTRALNDLAGRARTKKLQPDEVQGGTFTITNPGVFGSLMGTPIIMQPQVAILGIGAIEKRAKVVTGQDGEDTIAIRTCSYFSLSFDHRIIDGSVADQFMAQVRDGIEAFPDAEV